MPREASLGGRPADDSLGSGAPPRALDLQRGAPDAQACGGFPEVTPAPGEHRRLHGLSRRKKAEYVLEDAVRQGFYAASAPGHRRYCPLGRLPRRHSVEQAAGVHTLWNKKRLQDVRVSGAGANREDKRRTESLRRVPRGILTSPAPAATVVSRQRAAASRCDKLSRAAAGTGNGGDEQNRNWGTLLLASAGH